MLQSLFQRAEATVDNAISSIVSRIVVALPFIVAAGFATTAGSVYLVRELGALAGFSVMAGIFAFIGLVTAGVMAARSRSRRRAAVTTPAQAVESNGSGGEAQQPVHDGLDRDLMMAAATAVAPLALKAATRVVFRNLPLVAAIAAAGFVMSRPSEEAGHSAMQPAE